MIFFMFSLLHADFQEELCKDNLKSMSVSYYSAEKKLLAKEYSAALKEFEESVKFSQKALKSCENYPSYDFNYMYNYIVQSEIEISSIYDIQAHLE